MEWSARDGHSREGAMDGAWEGCAENTAGWV